MATDPLPSAPGRAAPTRAALDRCCDLVLKGGLTSGILYPPAICRIAERFHLVGVGGTSAGAIAGCLAAAAEYRRRTTDSDDGFRRLEQVPWELAGPGQLTALFRPDRETRDLFAFALQAQGLASRNWLARSWWKARALWKATRHRATLGPVVANGFGLCSGMANDNRPPAGSVPPLTAWLSDMIDEVAGKTGGEPLTFGDLRRAPIPPTLATTMAGASRSIDLRTVTTCVTFGRPYQLPFDDNHLFAFDPVEWRRLFPARVMDYLERAAADIPSTSRRRAGKLPLPVGDALPVVVAARMSLSFPGLFSMVPLWAVDYDAAPAADGSKPVRRVWFSDGGITSNLPIQTFDALFPRWPTLCLNLQYTDEGGRPSRAAVDDSLIYMIQRLGDGTNELWDAFDRGTSALGDLVGFAGAVFRSAQVWHDNAFLRLPGYRDRVAEIWLRPAEGGMNLEMPETVIKDLIARGDEAGRRLCARFADAPATAALSWESHRWTRLRSSLAGLATALRRFERSVRQPLPGDRSLAALLADREAPPAYRFTATQADDAREAIEDLLAWIAELDPADGSLPGTPDVPFEDGPRPPLEVVGRAPM